jgi:hypothetical protein
MLQIGVKDRGKWYQQIQQAGFHTIKDFKMDFLLKVLKGEKKLLTRRELEG